MQDEVGQAKFYMAYVLLCSPQEFGVIPVGKALIEAFQVLGESE